MIVKKNDKIYTVTEYPKKWTVSLDNGKLSVAYDISKEICSTEGELRDYIKNNSLF